MFSQKSPTSSLSPSTYSSSRSEPQRLRRTRPSSRTRLSRRRPSSSRARFSSRARLNRATRPSRRARRCSGARPGDEGRTKSDARPSCHLARSCSSFSSATQCTPGGRLLREASYLRPPALFRRGACPVIWGSELGLRELVEADSLEAVLARALVVKSASLRPRLRPLRPLLDS